MTHHAALDASQGTTAVCVVDDAGRVIAETKLPTCPDAIAGWLARSAADLARVGLETGPMAVWLRNALQKARVAVARKLAVVLRAMWKTQPPFRRGEAAA